MLRFDAVIFDMDGTLIEPLLDFRAIRSDLGIPPQCGIIEAIEAMPAERADRISRRLLEYELTAADEARLIDGAVETLGTIRAARLGTALLTRNARAAMERVFRKFPQLRFDLAWSRENGPIKPEPIGVLRACAELKVQPKRTACVGDYHYDVTAANDAGATSILLARGDRPEFADEADHVIARLCELPELLGI